MSKIHAHSHSDLHPPKILLIACVLMVLFALAGTGFVKLTGLGASRDYEVTAVESLSLVFADQAGGAILATNADTGEIVRRWEAETGGFVRTALRALARSRMISGVGPEAPFELTRSDEGRLILFDPSTGKRVTLEAFGSSNTASFAELLDPESAQR